MRKECHTLHKVVIHEIFQAYRSLDNTYSNMAVVSKFITGSLHEGSAGVILCCKFMLWNSFKGKNFYLYTFMIKELF